MVGPRPQVQQLRTHGQVAKRAQTAHAHDDAVEEHQRVPLGTAQVVVNIVEAAAFRARCHDGWRRCPAVAIHVGFNLRASASDHELQVVAKQLEQAQAGHHADHRRQVQVVVRHDRHGDGDQEQRHHHPGAMLQIGFILHRLRLTFTDGETQHAGGHQPVDQRRQEQREEFLEIAPGRPARPSAW